LNIGGDNSSFVEEAKKLDSYESIIKFVDKYYNDISEKIYGVDEDDMKKAIDKEYRDSVSFHSNGTLSVSESGLRNRFKINIIERISNFVDYKNKTAVKRSINSDFAKKHNLSEKEAEQVYENYIESTSLMIENPLNAIDDDGKKVMKSIGDVYKNQISSNQLKTVYDSDGKIVDFKDIQSKIKHSETQFMGINPIDIKTGIPSLVYEIEADNLKYRVNIPMPDVNIPLDNTANIKKALAKSSGIGDEPVLINDKEHILRKEWDKSHG
jgi:hypothetical protein